MKQWSLDTHVGTLFSQLGMTFAGFIISFLVISIIEQCGNGDIDKLQLFVFPSNLTVAVVGIWITFSITVSIIFFVKHYIYIEYSTDYIYIGHMFGKKEKVQYDEIKQYGLLTVTYYFAFHIVKEKAFFYLAKEYMSEEEAKKNIRKKATRI